MKEVASHTPAPPLSKGYHWEGNVAVNPETGDAARYSFASELDADEYDAELRAIRNQHDCGCEVCSKVSTVCPASASSYALEISRLRASNRKLLAALEALLADLNSEPGLYEGLRPTTIAQAEAAIQRAKP